jgi:hypothetical protein
MVEATNLNAFNEEIFLEHRSDAFPCGVNAVNQTSSMIVFPG